MTSMLELNDRIASVRGQTRVPWRDNLKLAQFRGAFFHCESNAKDNGRRIVMHEFPKKELPYAEDMGRRAYAFSVRAYCITYPRTLDGIAGQLFNRDYTFVRDQLINALETAGPGTLVLPTLPMQNVVVERYRVMEEEKFGGYCSFDIQFVEFGVPPNILTFSLNTANAITAAATEVRKQILQGFVSSVPGAPTPPGAIPNNPKPAPIPD